jgi:hypothetical protein
VVHYYFVLHIDGCINESDLVGLDVVGERLHVSLKVCLDLRPSLLLGFAVVAHQLGPLAELQVLLVEGYELVDIGQYR